MGSITIRIDDETKAQAEAELAQLGISHTDVITGVYRYIIRHHRLPFSPDDDALSAMQERLVKVADIATDLSLTFETPGDLSTGEWKSIIALLDRFTTELDSNWEAMRRASNGYLPLAWTSALQASKGLSYLLYITGKPHRQHVCFIDTSEISKAINHLVNACAEINRYVECDDS